MKKLCLVLLILLLFLPCAFAQSNTTFTYCLLSTDSLQQGDKLRIDMMLAKAGRVICTVYDENGTQAARFGVNREKGVPSKYNWDGTSDGKLLPAGNYVFTLRHERDNEDMALSFPLTITEKKETSISPELLFMPASMSDADVWAAMQAPVFVANVAERSHQKVYEKPDTKSTVVGKIHGQSQALEILSTPENGFVQVGFYRHEDGAYTIGYIPEKLIFSITPNPHYGILIDKAAQTLTVYIDGKPYSTLPVTTGLMVAGDTERETRAGAFVTTDHLTSFSSHGMTYEYPLGYDGGNLLHQLGYKKVNGAKDFSLETAILGQKDSHGCVRMPNEANAEGVNAEWLYQNIPYHTKVLVLPDYNSWAARMTEIGEMQSAPSVIPTVTPQSDKDALITEPTKTLSKEDYDAKTGAVTQSIVVTAGGDAVLGSEEKTRAQADSFDRFVLARGYSWPFSGLYDLFSSDDITFVNLECVLKNDARNKVSKLYNFRGLTDFTSVLTAGSVEIVNIANNHYIDYGASGKASTRNALEAANIPYSGYGYTYVYEINGVKIGFGGIRETIYLQDATIMDKDIAELKAQGCDVIVYACHFGTEYVRTHNALQTQMAHRAIDDGADIVIGHHPHVVQGVEVYKNCPIFYSLGNLTFGGNLELTEFDAALAQLTLDFKDGVYVGVRAKILPILDTGSAPYNDFRPVLARGEETERILQKIQDDSEIKITADEMYLPR